MARARRRWRWLPRSRRARAAVVATVVVAAVLLLADFGLIGLQRHALEHSIESTARSEVERVAALLRKGAPAADLLQSQEGQGQGDMIQVVDGAGGVTAASPGLRGLPGTALDASGHPSDGDPGTGVTVAHLRQPPSDASPPGPYLVLSAQVQAPDGPRTVHVAAPLHLAELAARTTGIDLGVGSPLLVLLVAAAAWILTGNMLRPAEAIRTRAAERQQRFVADVSHELRSPLATIQAQLDVALAHPERADWVTTANEVGQETRRMQRIVEDLLLLARADEGAVPLRRETVDLDELVLAEARRLRNRGMVRVDTSKVSAARVSGDRDRLTQVVRNLAANAERHASQMVRLEVGQSGGVAEMVVADDGPGIPPADRERVFKRFTRLDEARSAERGGAGLGLAIAREILTAHGGTIEVDDQHAGAQHAGARLVVRLPVAADAPVS